MGLSIHSLGVVERRDGGEQGPTKGFTKEFILLVFGCSEGGQCGDLSLVGGVHW